MGVLCALVYGLGLYVAFRIALHIAFEVYRNVAPMLGQTADVCKFGKWAVVTGATDGIGKAYALKFAERGLNIVLVSRTKAKLTAVADEIKAAHKVETKEIVADFTKTDIYDSIGSQLEGLDVGILVNNVGMSYDHPEYLEQVPQPHEFVMRLVAMNVVSVSRMSLLVLEGMKQRRRGLIVNISSLSAVAPTPLLTLYAATKAFVVSFSENLRLECEASNVQVQCVVPGFVATAMSKLRRATLMAPCPKAFVAHAVNKIGTAHFTAAYWPHHLMMTGMTLLAEHLPGYGKRALVHMASIKGKALRKKEREAKAQ